MCSNAKKTVTSWYSEGILITLGLIHTARNGTSDTEKTEPGPILTHVASCIAWCIAVWMDSSVAAMGFSHPSLLASRVTSGVDGPYFDQQQIGLCVLPSKSICARARVFD